MRESAVPISEQEISNRLENRLAKVQQRIDSLFGQGLIEQVPGPHLAGKSAARLENL